MHLISLRTLSNQDRELIKEAVLSACRAAADPPVCCHVYGDYIYVVTQRGGEGTANYKTDRKQQYLEIGILCDLAHSFRVQHHCC